MRGTARPPPIRARAARKPSAPTWDACPLTRRIFEGAGGRPATAVRNRPSCRARRTARRLPVRNSTGQSARWGRSKRSRRMSTWPRRMKDARKVAGRRGRSPSGRRRGRGNRSGGALPSRLLRASVRPCFPPTSRSSPRAPNARRRGSIAWSSWDRTGRGSSRQPRVSSAPRRGADACGMGKGDDSPRKARRHRKWSTRARSMS